MILSYLAAAALASTCPNGTVQEAATSVLNDLRNVDFSCIGDIILNKDLKFTDGKIDSSVMESLNFKPKGKNSYMDIIKDGVFIAYSAGKGEISAFYISKRYAHEFRNNEKEFKKKFYMKKYFVCNFKKVNGAWRLTEDLCFTEGEID